jgi:peptide deformylase
MDFKSLPSKLKKDLEMLKFTAAHHQLVALAANQVRMTHRAFAILKEPLIRTGQWSGYEHKVEDYELVVNPQRLGETTLKFKDF